MSLDPPPYLFSLQNNIRARPIPWEGAVRAGTITEFDLRSIKAVDKVRKDQRKEIVEQDPDQFVNLLIGSNDGKAILQSASKRTDVIQYMLVLAGDLLTDCPSLGPRLLQQQNPYHTLLPYLKHSANSEDPIPLLTSSVLTTLTSIAQSQSSQVDSDTLEALKQLYNYESSLTKSSDSSLKDIAILQYSTALKSKQSRELFWDNRAQTVTPLMEILREASGVSKDAESTLWSGGTSVRGGNEANAGGVGLQLLYHVLLVIWQLSFEAELVARDLEKEHELVPLYTQLLRSSPKEKTTRLLLSTLLSLLSAPNTKSFLLPIATSARLPGVLSNLKSRHLTDPDLLDDLKAISDMLEEYTNSQTTFDEYAAEVQSGRLHWSPPHKDANFWRNNARKIVEDNGGSIPKQLAEILNKQWEGEKVQLAIACNDVGWMVKEAPEQRSKLEKLGMKVRVMELMQDSNETVRWESLRAVGEWLRYSFER